MRRVGSGLLLAALSAAAVATPVSARPVDEGRCIAELARAGLAGPSTNPSTLNIVTGTDGADDFRDDLTAGADLICGFGGDDRVFSIRDSDVFIGGDGNDAATFMYAGTFVGGPGSDVIDSFYGGTFDGGDGNDWAIGMNTGTFIGGEGNDAVSKMHGGSFSGGVGNDWVGFMFGGTFNGEVGDDWVGYLGGGTFNGGEGNDVVHGLSTNGTFNQD
jgi:hypothetical protein